ncbi:MAG: 2-(1,2-epoxy,2-dihydrophenyl)acetyl-CoA isomerase [Gaiellales bacterium]|nr:2-(1,2-epoxy,2-dihydrophenyl)acetyl-CoA isomerase [Gaiellales bacterium]
MEVETRRDGAVLTITLNRPEVLNALNEAMHEGLAGALQQAVEQDVRAVVITGAGRGFCVGADVSELPREPQAIGELLRSRFNPNIRMICRLEKPVIAAVNGPAAGAGLALAMACDLRLAAESASFVPAFLGIGLVPDSGLTHTLPRVIGPAAAFEWLVSGRRMAAADAAERGLVSRVVPDDELAAATTALTDDLVRKPTVAVGLTKRLIGHAGEITLDEQLDLEAKLQAVAAGTMDFAEGIAAFLEKRPPDFTGR